MRILILAYARAEPGRSMQNFVIKEAGSLHGALLDKTVHFSMQVQVCTVRMSFETGFSPNC